MKIHLIGIGGVGMSALATALAHLGEEVCGSDRNLHTANIAALEARGIRCYPEGEGIDSDVAEVIVSTAIEADNPGLKIAARLNIPVTHRAKALARTLAHHRLIAVVGTCGKSTVTAMLGHVLTECGFAPFCVNGANVPGWDGAVLPGNGALAVAEVDESDRSLVAFSPWAAIVTNASADHFSEAEMNEVFDAFIQHCEGPVVDARQFSPELVATSLPGVHNQINASIVLEMACQLGCDEQAVREALLNFGGVERRLQRYGNRVFDDYAHNPEKLRAMWLTLAEISFGEGVCVLWRPHGYAPLRKMLTALAQMFAATIGENDALLLLPVYDAGGTTDRSINSDALVAAIAEARQNAKKPPLQVVEVADHEAAFQWMTAHRDQFAIFATCGARDPDLPSLAARLAASV